jgi:hypothetical protein
MNVYRICHHLENTTLELVRRMRKIEHVYAVSNRLLRAMTSRDL